MQLALITGLTVLALVMLPKVGAASDPTFTQVCFSDNLAPAMAVGDFNHDGKLDVAINPGAQQIPIFLITNLVDVYLGNGDGTFSGPTRVDAGAGYLDMAAADLNNDGDLDLVMTTGSMTILQGHGDGTFTQTKSYPGGDARLGLVAVDLSQDGSVDIAVTDYKAAAVFLNKGDGTFKDRVLYPTGGPNAQVRAIAAGDINGDGLPDLVTLSAGSPNGVSVLLGKGGGKFQRHLDTSLPGFPGRDLAVADFDGDGKMDVVVPVQGGDGVLVLRGNGDGTFGAPTGYPMPGNTLHIAVGDLDGDGKQDIVAGNYVANFPPDPGGNVSILYGDGSGGFALGSVIPVAFGHGVLVADINGDSRSDIVADACVLLNDGAAAATTPSHLDKAGQPKLHVSTMGLAPNPLRNHGKLSFSLAKDGTVSVRLYDLRGRRVRTLMESAWLPAGPHTLSLDRSQAGLEAGVYFYRIKSTAGAISGRFVVLDD